MLTAPPPLYVRPVRRIVLDLVIAATLLVGAVWLVLAFNVVPPEVDAPAHRITLGEWLLLANVATLVLAGFGWRRLRLQAKETSTLSQRDPKPLAAACTDVVTGVASADLFDVELGEALAGGASSTLLLVEAIGFDRVEATCGHDEATRVLGALAKRLRAANDTCDLVARLDGPTFAVLMRGIASPDVARAMGDLMVRAMAEPIFVDRTLHRITGAVGATLLDPGADAAAALEQARFALDQAKRAGRSAVTLCAQTPVAAAA